MVVITLGRLFDHERDLGQRPALTLSGTPPGSKDRERVTVKANQVQIDRLAGQVCDHPTLSSAETRRTPCSTVNTL
ncbi:hypothetical protein [Caudoviricetes sp.]|nr:hypothetical protein [Caudoviricetes sp.]